MPLGRLCISESVGLNLTPPDGGASWRLHLGMLQGSGYPDPAAGRTNQQQLWAGSANHLLNNKKIKKGRLQNRLGWRITRWRITYSPAGGVRLCRPTVRKLYLFQCKFLLINSSINQSIISVGLTNGN